MSSNIVKIGGIFYKNDYDDHFITVKDNRVTNKLIKKEDKEQIKNDIENLMKG